MNGMVSLAEELKKEDFRVVIFGSARINKGDRIYRQVFNLAKAIGEMGADLVTGGGPGLMDAASAGHEAGTPENESHTIGINIKLPKEQKPNKHLDIVQQHKKFSSRLDQFIEISNVIVVTPGGVGTILELFFALQLMQVGHACKIPVILIGKMWEDLLQWVKKWPLQHHLISKSDLYNVFYARTQGQALKIIKKTYDEFQKGNPKACPNCRKKHEKQKNS